MSALNSGDTASWHIKGTSLRAVGKPAPLGKQELIHNVRASDCNGQAASLLNDRVRSVSISGSVSPELNIYLKAHAVTATAMAAMLEHDLSGGSGQRDDQALAMLLKVLTAQIQDIESEHAPLSGK